MTPLRQFKLFSGLTRCSNSCKNSAVPAPPPRVSKQDPAPTVLLAVEAMLGPGHGARLVGRLLGVSGTTIGTTRVVPQQALPEGLHHGRVTVSATGTVAIAALMVVMEEVIATILAATAPMAAPLLLQAPLPGISPWPPRPHIPDTRDTAVTARLVLHRELGFLPLACLLPRRLLLVARRLASLAD